jgi:hypothetical protein
MNLLEEARKLLEENAYEVGSSGSDQIQFEDASLMGFLWAATSAEALLSQWQGRQDSFLRKNAPMLRKSEYKTWNIYAVFLTDATGEPSQLIQIKQIEEDFRGARKIARANITITSQLVNALYPFLPIQNIVPFEPQDALQRVRDRLSELPSSAVDALLNSETPENAVRAFLEAYEIK